MTVLAPDKMFWWLERTRGGFLGVLVLTVLSWTLGPLGGCESENVGPRPSEALAPPTLEVGKAKLGEILVKSVSSPIIAQLNLSVGGKPLSIGEQQYQTGIGTHSVSRIAISFPAKYKTFTGSCGVDDEVADHGSVVFKVMDGQKVLFESPLMKGGMKAVAFSAPVKGLSVLTLVVEDGGDNFNWDHADWVNLNLE